MPPLLRPLAHDLLAIGEREKDEIAARFPKVQRRVGGYNLDALVQGQYQGRNDVNLAHVLVGSEGTLGFSTRIELKLAPLLGRRAVGAVHFGSFRAAMETARNIVHLLPIGVELIDRTLIELAREIPIFRPTLDKFVRETAGGGAAGRIRRGQSRGKPAPPGDAQGHYRRSRFRLGQAAAKNGAASSRF